jgi:nucleotide-binding universal stress UspA family protein
MSTNAVVVGYDGTDGGHAALDEAIKVAQELGGSVVVIYAYDKVMMGGELRDLDAVIGERGNALLAEAAATAAAAGVAATTQFVEGRPADALVAAADVADARFIVVGSYGERPIRGALVGSTPYRLIHLAERPVIVVRIPE